VATVNPVEIRNGHSGGADIYEWLGLADGDTVGWLTLPIKADKSVHVYGAFGGTVTIQGSHEDVPANPVTLNDSRGEGNPLTFTATDLRVVLEPVLKIRPLPGGGVSDTTVRLLAVRGG